MRLGEGGMGRVYLGRSPTGRMVALKLVHAGLVGTPGFRERFAREVRMSRTVTGAGTVPVVAADPEAAVPWLASAYVPGPSLAEAVHQHGPFATPALWRMLSGLGEALEAVHTSGLVHRDLKPSNVLLSLDRPLLIDFGIARAADEAGLTGTGLVVGSPGYMSPEQAEGREVSPSGDVFSLGAVLAFAATGRSPFGGGSSPELLYRIVHHAPDLSGVDEALADVVRECLAKAPGQRPSPSALRERADAAIQDAGTDWLPAPVASAIARRAEQLLNMEGERTEATGTDDRPPSGARPTAVVTEVVHDVSPGQHAAPTQAAGRYGAVPPPRPPFSPPAGHRTPGFHEQTAFRPDGAGASRRRGSAAKAAAVLGLTVVAVATGVIIALNTADPSTPSGSGGDTSASQPAVPATGSPAEGGTERTAPAAEPPAEQPTKEVSPVEGEWRGTYRCGQGETGLTLTITDTDGALTATFDFYPIDSNPDVPRGSFAMRGTRVGTRMDLYGDHWIARPEDYLMVGLSAEFAGGSPQALVGPVTDTDGAPSDSCAAFSVERQ
ncbi:serine/threonine-protein kinase [Streptomyces sp. NBC_00059]|uniref:serine/threonine-protein kinase n=1 Tax=Streptomyces sp. NBC_00059 TaxID=2975635 RepID=UPI002252F43B|nr:protein kinase [Streptomyces sp. NBC_00059]MCX5410421.1 protein kinase [Streptomyces sp. NBC_00059]